MGQFELAMVFILLFCVKGARGRNFGNQGGAKITIASLVVAKMSINIGFFFELIL